MPGPERERLRERRSRERWRFLSTGKSTSTTAVTGEANDATTRDCWLPLVLLTAGASSTAAT